MTTMPPPTANKPLIALYDKDERLSGVVAGWRLADHALENDPDIRKAVVADELTITELVEIDDKIAELRQLRKTL
jgi:predicted amino acid-binding ACT domain protein